MKYHDFDRIGGGAKKIRLILRKHVKIVKMVEGYGRRKQERHKEILDYDNSNHK